MMEMLARVNDKTENPDRPWVIKDIRGGKEQWVYYCNTDWYHEMFEDEHPVRQHSISVSGGSKNIKYFLSGGYDRQTGIMKATEPDVFQKYNMRKDRRKAEQDHESAQQYVIHSSDYSWIGVGDIQDVFRNLRHTLRRAAFSTLTEQDFTTTRLSSVVTTLRILRSVLKSTALRSVTYY